MKKISWLQPTSTWGTFWLVCVDHGQIYLRKSEKFHLFIII